MCWFAWVWMEKQDLHTLCGAALIPHHVYISSSSSVLGSTSSAHGRTLSTSLHPCVCVCVCVCVFVCACVGRLQFVMAI